jgi:hypothetical protein
MQGLELLERRQAAALGLCVLASRLSLLRSCRLGMLSRSGFWVRAAAWSAFFLSRLAAFALAFVSAFVSAGESWGLMGEGFSAASGVSGTKISVEGLGGV